MFGGTGRLLTPPALLPRHVPDSGCRRSHPEFPLVVAANRDEFFARPTAPAAVCRRHRRLSAAVIWRRGGTWLGIGATGRFAAVTNVREPGQPAGSRSRGILTRDSCSAIRRPKATSPADGDAFAGFNLPSAMVRRSAPQHRDGSACLLPLVFGWVSNHALDKSWPKLTTAKRAFRDARHICLTKTGSSKLLADDDRRRRRTSFHRAYRWYGSTARQFLSARRLRHARLTWSPGAAMVQAWWSERWFRRRAAAG